MTTIHVNAPSAIGDGTLTAYARRRDTGALVNTGGDTATESPANSGHYTFDLAESVTGLGILRIDLNDAGGIVCYAYLAEGETVCQEVDIVITSDEPTGARTVTITVNDGTTVLQNALVRVTQGVESYTGLTNASGVVTFNLDDATWTIAITKSGYSYAGTTLVVDGNETVTYSMTEVGISPGTGNLTTGYLTALDEEGVAEAGAIVYCEMTKAPASDTGYSYDSKIRSATSAVNGLVELEGLVKGATYRIWRGQRIAAATNNLVLIPTSAVGTYELPSHIGREQS